MLFLLLSAFLASGQAQDRVVVPARLELPFLRVYQDVKKASSGESVELSVSALLPRRRQSPDPQENWDFRTGQGRHFVSSERFARMRREADAVLEATTGDNFFGYGTAFHIGEGFVLTNQHVLSTSRENSTQCQRFKAFSPALQTRYGCERVVYCNRAADYCLIKLKAPSRWAPALEQLASLRLAPGQKHSSEESLVAIGNSGGEGLHYSQGRGARRHDEKTLKFFAPVHSGNSGGPLLNAASEVVGVVYAQGHYGVNDQSYNLAVPIDFIRRELLEKLPSDPDWVTLTLLLH